MAATPSNFTRLQPSLQATWLSAATGITTMTLRRHISRQLPVHPEVTLRSFPQEPEDACLTGGTRSLDRRLLALNLSMGKPAVGAAAKSKGQCVAA